MSATLATFSGIATALSAFSAPLPIQIDDVILEGWEVPASIKWGGKQQLTVHKLPGGVRVIDAMGRDDDPLTWTGILQGPGATVRGRMLDELRIAGAEVGLSWGDFDYTVVVDSFTCDYTKPYWQPYTISCSVLRDEAQADDDDDEDDLSSVQGDIGNAADLDNVDDPTVTSGVATAQQQSSTMTALSSGSAPTTALGGALTSTQGVVNSDFGDANTGLGGVSSVADVNSATSNAGNLAGLSATSAYIGSASKTVAAA